MERAFSSGSRQAPDPIDQFLEGHNYYRKHTARDASCLFRVISEQIYDSQLHHLAIREKCVSYMRKHWQFFQRLVERDFDEYLDDMSKLKTYGTLLELQALGRLFQRNIILFEPFNLGNHFNEYRVYYDAVFRVFYTPERHFDSVFTAEYIREAAICQSICYEIIYKDLFKLPDVTFAVEQMLHAAGFENVGCFTQDADDGYYVNMSLTDGRFFQFDLPQNTNCILENYKYCHFHYANFPRFSQDLLNQIKQTKCGEHENSLLVRTTESFLTKKDISCVRQLLQEGITPFPYKVAKALDSNMYRNIEFDTWSEIRKEMKLQNWYSGDSNFKVGAKCHVKLCKSGEGMFTCHIQEMPVDKGYCIVFVEQLGEKRIVPYESLSPLPPDQFKPWSLPYRFQKQMKKYSSLRFTRHCNYHFKVGKDESFADCNDLKSELCCYKAGLAIENDKSLQRQCRNSKYKLNQYTHLENFRTHAVEYCTMPLAINMRSRNDEGNKKPSNTNDLYPAPAYSSPSHFPMEPKDDTTVENALVFAGHSNLASCEFEQQVAGPGPVHMPDVQCFYHPLQPYAGVLPEDYPGYAYECNIPPVPMQPSSFVPIVNGAPGPLYYVCNSAGSVYMSPTLSMQSSIVPPPTGPKLLLPSNSYHNSAPSLIPNSEASVTTKINQSVVSHPNVSPPTGSSIATQQNSSNSPTINYRINFDAKRSVKTDGGDLPTNIATLRHFYNLGIDYYHKYLKRNNSDVEFKENVNKTSGELKNWNRRENVNQAIETNQVDLNNNIKYSNNNNKYNNNNHNNNKGNQQRRFISRYFNNRNRHGGSAPSNRSITKQSSPSVHNSFPNQSNSNSSKNSSASSVQNIPVETVSKLTQNPKYMQQAAHPSPKDQSSMSGFDSNSTTEFGVENFNRATFHGQYAPSAFNINNEQYGENRTMGNYLPPPTTHARPFVQMQMTAAPCNFQLPSVGIHPSVIAPPDEHAGSSLSNVTMSLSSSENANLQSTYPPPPVPFVYPSCVMPTSLNTTNPKSMPLDGGVNIANGPNIMAPHHNPLAHMGPPQGYWCLPPPHQTPFQPNTIPLLSGAVANINLTAETQESRINTPRNKTYEKSTTNNQN
uniref:OTU domain-containing protein n=1 Tax=Glossina austeni TaxID=7395 RepID=A0A1A9V0H8_GLOAU